MTLFSRFDIFPKERKVIVQVSPNFDYMVNRISANFTSYELHEFTQIRSTYAKSVYRLLKQWRTIGKKEFDINEFKRLLDTPEYYGPSEIDKNILKPVSRELTQYFKKLKIKKVKANTVVLQLLVTFSLGNLKRLKNGSITNIKNEKQKKTTRLVWKRICR